jgi:hypothetical protein
VKPVIGHHYRTAGGGHADIFGLAHHPDTVWSLQGNWYSASDGRFLSYVQVEDGPDGWKHVPGREPHHDLVEDLGLSPHFSPRVAS